LLQFNQGCDEDIVANELNQISTQYKRRLTLLQSMSNPNLSIGRELHQYENLRLVAKFGTNLQQLQFYTFMDEFQSKSDNFSLFNDDNLTLSHHNDGDVDSRNDDTTGKRKKLINNNEVHKTGKKHGVIDSIDDLDDGLLLDIFNTNQEYDIQSIKTTPINQNDNKINSQLNKKQQKSTSILQRYNHLLKFSQESDLTEQQLAHYYSSLPKNLQTEQHLQFLLKFQQKPENMNQIEQLHNQTLQLASTQHVGDNSATKDDENFNFITNLNHYSQFDYKFEPLAVQYGVYDAISNILTTFSLL
jgi:hypothetical protein